MASGADRSKRRRFSWRRPRYKDPAFWTAVGITVLLIALQVLVVGDLSQPLTWLSLAFRGVVVWLVVSAVIRLRVGLRRGLVAGFAEAEVRAEQRASGQSAPEAFARASGRTVGRVMGAYKRGRG